MSESEQHHERSREPLLLGPHLGWGAVIGCITLATLGALGGLTGLLRTECRTTRLEHAFMLVFNVGC
jgi:hypothetical protein